MFFPIQLSNNVSSFDPLGHTIALDVMEGQGRTVFACANHVYYLICELIT